MHSIERYGAIALIFLIVTVIAVLTWDTGGDEPAAASRVAEAPGPARALEPPRATSPPSALAGKAAGDAVATLSARPRPLRRDLEPLVPEGEPATAPALGGGATRLEPRTPADPARSTAGPQGAAGAAEASGAPAPKPLVRPEPRIYVVRGNDTLSEIALRELGTSRRWPEIVDLNPGLNPAKLLVGARLKLPQDGAAPAAVAPPAASRTAPEPEAEPPSRASAPAGTYRVQDGDSLWRIAQRALGDGERWDEILALNPGLDAKRLVVGTALRLPEGARPAASAPAPTIVAKAEPAPAETTRASGGTRKGRVR